VHSLQSPPISYSTKPKQFNFYECESLLLVLEMVLYHIRHYLYPFQSEIEVTKYQSVSAQSTTITNLRITLQNPQV